MSKRKELARAMEDNVLIAEFMGMKYSDEKSFNNGEWTHSIKSLSKFETSWDWLMPVVEKCLEMHNNLIDGRDIINTSYTSIAQALQVVSFKETYKSVVEFINQLNKNN